ncbi:hypothetical protein GQX74_008767 [Glossina fuscipes]|nr:hypothetical protein GQX74_008767 [Glossina fuscipes]
MAHVCYASFILLLQRHQHFRVLSYGWLPGMFSLPSYYARLKPLSTGYTTTTTTTTTTITTARTNQKNTKESKQTVTAAAAAAAAAAATSFILINITEFKSSNTCVYDGISSVDTIIATA